MSSYQSKEILSKQGIVEQRKTQPNSVDQVLLETVSGTTEPINDDELIYYDQFCGCQEFVMEECLQPLLYSSLLKILPASKMSNYNQALLQSIIKQVYHQVSAKLKKQLSALQDKYHMKENFIQIQRIKQEYQVLSDLGYSENIVDQDENQIFFELLLKNMKLLSNSELTDANHLNKTINII